eukprot:COSAG02_NODE_11976_length_1621_cov_2.099869_2_plen_94_part_00
MTFNSVSLWCSRAVTNIGGASAADEVLMAYHFVGPAIRAAAKHPVPIKELVAFERVAGKKSKGLDTIAIVGAGKLALGVHSKIISISIDAVGD